MMQRDLARCRLGLTVALMTEFEMPDAFGFFDIGCFQLRHFLEATTSKCRDQTYPWQGTCSLILGWRDLEFGIGKQRS